MKKLIAALLCLLLLLPVFALFAFIQTGGYTRVLAGEWNSEFDCQLPFTSGHFRLTAIAGIVLALFWALDVYALTTRPPDRSHERGMLPVDHPIGYAVLRLRRYSFLAMVFGYAVLVFRVQPLAEPLTPPGTTACLITYAALFAAARRPVNWTPGDVLSEVISGFARFLAGFSGQR